MTAVQLALRLHCYCLSLNHIKWYMLYSMCRINTGGMSQACIKVLGSSLQLLQHDQTFNMFRELALIIEGGTKESVNSKFYNHIFWKGHRISGAYCRVGPRIQNNQCIMHICITFSSNMATFLNHLVE